MLKKLLYARIAMFNLDTYYISEVVSKAENIGMKTLPNIEYNLIDV